MAKEEIKKEEKVEHIEVTFEDLTNIDPTKIEGKNPEMDYRFINQRLIDLRKRQGYIPVDAEKEGVHAQNIIGESGKSADTTTKFMDTVLYKRPKVYQEMSDERKKEKKERMKRNLQDWMKEAKKDLMSRDEKKINRRLEELNEVTRL